MSKVSTVFFLRFNPANKTSTVSAVNPAKKIFRFSFSGSQRVRISVSGDYDGDGKTGPGVARYDTTNASGSLRR